jgi:hypothetical protein
VIRTASGFETGALSPKEEPSCGSNNIVLELFNSKHE